MPTVVLTTCYTFIINNTCKGTHLFICPRLCRDCRHGSQTSTEARFQHCALPAFRHLRTPQSAAGSLFRRMGRQREKQLLQCKRASVKAFTGSTLRCSELRPKVSR